MKLPNEISFLDEIFLEPREKYSRADWLLSNFSDSVWIYKFHQKSTSELNWDVHFHDGSNLLDSRHKELLISLKYWLIISTHPTATAGIGANSLRYQSRQFNGALAIFDYLLLNAEQLGLLSHGLTGLHNDNLKVLLDKIAKNNASSEAFYDWSDRLSQYLLDEVEKADHLEIEDLLRKKPDLGVITPDQTNEKRLSIPINQVPKVRAILFLKGFYYENRENFKLTANSKKLSSVILRNTLKAKKTKKPLFLVLNLPNENVSRREYPSAPVSNNNNDRVNEDAFSCYRNIIYALGALKPLNLPIPKVDFQEIARYSPQTSAKGRFRTLPSTVVFSAVRNAMEFHFKYSNALLTSYCRLAEYAVKRKIALFEIPNKDFHRLMHSSLIDLGVSQLGFVAYQKGLVANKPFKGEHDVYFSRLRSSKGLLELIAVYYGAVLTVVGATMARRQGELNDLVAGKCLDESNKWLLFENRKSTKSTYGLRNTEARPIDQTVAEMIVSLENFQKKLLDIGAINELTNLFAYPDMKGFLILRFSTNAPSSVTDLFCDYFSSPINQKGERYYHRQHQLRRFFAMLFFYSSSFGGLETLQWFLGQTDRKHVWRYISESTDGAVLRNAKAQYIVEQLYEGNSNYEELIDLIKARFGTEDFMIIDKEDAEDYVVSLQNEGLVEIEPDFIEDDEGEKMEVILHIKELK
ncbi:Integrase [Vibrio crassostreae]|nr:Integrase [Vibrio crassostreae]CAK1816782.1 Integrase [Vibrio crassostreae]CAK2428005.1 Integrase [Vibrio crassostreae]CAK2702972.1 Integrase [Vibrio crassostreae]CAK2756300.1 Integrase [Vibrio crassostreae]